ncbi:MFS transporter [Mariniluteicoccus endophyticus]
MSAGERRVALRWFVLTGMVLVTLQLRAPITGVPPALSRVAESLALGPTAAGAVTSLPLVCFGIFAFLTPFLAARVGLEPTLWAAASLVLAGLAVRHDARLVTFFAGTLLVGMGIALGNVALPALARAWFPDRLPLAMGVYTVMIQVSGSAGPFLTAPLLAAGWAWRDALSIWFVPGVLALVVWTVVNIAVARQRHGHPHHAAEPAGMGSVVRRRLTWTITFVQGTQSLVFFALLTWIPVQLRMHGFNEATIGVLMGIYSILGLPGSFWAARLARGLHGRTRVVVLTVVYVVALLLLPVSRPAVVVGLLVCGVCQGLWLVVSLTFIASQADPRDVPAVSALAQGTGYLWAALGPVAVGALYATTGTLVAGEALMAVLVIAMGVTAVGVARQVHA